MTDTILSGPGYAVYWNAPHVTFEASSGDEKLFYSNRCGEVDSVMSDAAMNSMAYDIETNGASDELQAAYDALKAACVGKWG